MALAHEREALAVRRKGYGAIDVFDEQLRRSAEDRSAVERREGVFGLVAPDAVDVAAVGRKGDPGIQGSGWRLDLRIAHGRDVAQPQGLQAVLLADMQEIFAVGGERGLVDVTVVGEILDGELLEGQMAIALQEGVDTECSGDEYNHYDDGGKSRAELVLSRGFDNDGAAGLDAGRRGSGCGGVLDGRGERQGHPEDRIDEYSNAGKQENE